MNPVAVVARAAQLLVAAVTCSLTTYSRGAAGQSEVSACVERFAARPNAQENAALPAKGPDLTAANNAVRSVLRLFSPSAALSSPRRSKLG
jgi:hypothetical protein